MIVVARKKQFLCMPEQLQTVRQSRHGPAHASTLLAHDGAHTEVCLYSLQSLPTTVIISDCSERAFITLLYHL